MNIPPERYTKINSIKTRYFAEGEGSPVVLIHGLGGSASGWLLSFSAIAGRHRTYALDLIGHGRTDPPESGSLNAADLARFVIGFMAELKIERAHIVGHSMGGGITLQIAIDFPERVNKLVLADSIGLGKESILLARIASLPLLGGWLFSRDYRPDKKRYADGLRSGARNAAYITDELIDTLYLIERGPEHARIVHKIFRLWFDWTGQKKSMYGPILRNLPAIQNPALIIWGRQDTTVPLSHGELAAKSIPNARLEEIDQCAHVPMFEQPEIFNRLVLEFLNE